jgi:hypothetical protein
VLVVFVVSCRRRCRRRRRRHHRHHNAHAYRSSPLCVNTS